MSKFTKCDKLMHDLLVLERGQICQICGKEDKRVGVFHVLNKSTHPRLRYIKENLLLACWFPCHDSWHHSFFKAREIEKKIKQLLGDDYEERLKILNRTCSKVDLKLTELWLRAELIKNNPRGGGKALVVISDKSPRLKTYK